MAQNAGFKAKLSISGTSTAITGEACSVVSGKTYHVTNSAKRVLDPTVARTWKDNGVAVSASNIASEDLLFGQVTFVAGYTPTLPITLDGSYLPRNAIASLKGCKVTLKQNTQDVTALNGTGDRILATTTRTAMMTADAYDDLRADLDPGTGGEQSFYTLLTNRTPKLFELDMSGAGTWVVRAWVLPEGADVSNDANAIVAGNVSWTCADQGTATAAASFELGAP